MKTKIKLLILLLTMTVVTYGKSTKSPSVQDTIIDSTTVTLSIRQSTSICNPNGSVSFSINGPAQYAPYYFTWSYNVQYYSPTGVATQLAPGAYRLTIGDHKGGQLMDTVITITGPSKLVTVPMASTYSVCQNQKITLSQKAFGDTSGYVYWWYGIPAIGRSDSIYGQTINIAPLYSTYMAAVQDANGCMSNDTIHITHNPTPSSYIIGNMYACEGSAALIKASQAGNKYLWMPSGDTSRTCAATQTGTYTLTATNSYGCTSVGTASVTMMNTPSPSVSCVKAVLQTEAFSTYQWFANDTIFTGQVAQTCLPPMQGKYQVQVTNINGCANISTPYDYVAGLSTGIDPIVDNSKFKAYISDRTVNFLSTEALDVHLFDMSGKLLYASKTNEAHIPVTEDGIYILSTEKGNIKLISQ